MARSMTLRVVALAALGIASLFGVWSAHSYGRSILGPVGAVLIAIVAALMLGAIVAIAWFLLFARSEIRREGRT